MRAVLILLACVVNVEGRLAAPRSRAKFCATRPAGGVTNSARSGVVRGGAGTMSESAAVVSLIKTIIGGGMLALPAGMAAGKGTGIGPAVAIVALHAALSAYTYTLVGRSVAKSGAQSFGELWAQALSPKTSWMIDAMIVGVAGGACLTYGCFLGELLSQLVPGLSRTAAIIILAAFPMAPLALQKDLSALKHSSILGISAVVVSAVVIIMRALDGSYAAGGAFGGWLKAAPAALTQITTSRVSVGTCVLFNMLSTAFMAHTNAVRAYNELADPSAAGRIAAVSFGGAAALYTSVMLAAYTTFGSSAKGLILANFANNDPLALATRVATLVSLLSSHPILFTGLRDSVFSLAQPLVTPVLRRKGGFTALSLGLLALPTALAILTPDVGFVVSITGASVGAALICIVPSILYLKLPLAANEKKGSPERTFLKVVAAFGFAVAAFGSTVTCLESFTDLLD